eukprot:scaffold3626_cov69-Skeletonema_dohrnii-CCMP3373.AAC.2
MKSMPLITSAQTIALKLTVMRSPLARLLLIGCALFPEAAFGRTVSLYHVIRALPTSSPTATPSYQPSARPSSHPTVSPSSLPSSSPTSSPSSRPSLRPTLQPTDFPQPSSKPTIAASLSIQQQLQTSEAMANVPFGTTLGFWEIASLALIVILFCFIGIGSCLALPKQRTDEDTVPPEGDVDRERWDWLSSSFWLGEQSFDESLGSLDSSWGDESSLG